MKYFLASFFLLLILFLTVFPIPNTVWAADVIIDDPKVWLGAFSETGVISPSSLNLRASLPSYIVSVVLFALIITSLFFLLIGGIKWIMSGGTKDGVAKAKGTITYALIGLALGLGSFLILRTVLTLVGAKLF